MLKIHWGKRLATLPTDASDAQIDAILDEVLRITCDQVKYRIVFAADKHSKLSLNGVLV